VDTTTWDRLPGIGGAGQDGVDDELLGPDPIKGNPTVAAGVDKGGITSREALLRFRRERIRALTVRRAPLVYS
jgi:hypothetical protein